MPLPKVLVLILAGGAGNRPSNGRLWDLDRTTGGPDARVGDGSEGDVTLVGRAAELAAGTVVPPGGRLPEDE